MSKIWEIQIDRDNANDQEITVVKLYRASGTPVQAGDPLFDAESSKATQEIVAPSEGVLIHGLVEGLKVPYGTTIAKIVPPGTNDLSVPFGAETQPPPAKDRIRSRLSPAAASLAAKYGLSEQHFKTSFVTAAHIEVARNGGARNVSPASARAHPPRLHRGTPVLPRKRDEITMLSSGAGNSMLSVLGVQIGAIVDGRKQAGLFAKKITDLVIFEASRLMHKYPGLNSLYEEGAIQSHLAVNAGIALDEGGRLLVYGITNSDKKDLATLQLEIEDALGRYAERKLTEAEVTRATFTVTDLSSQTLNFVFPLLPVNQSSIIGITRGADNSFNLYVGFDHRVTEGLGVAKFLQELRDRILSFFPPVKIVPRCSFCDKSAEEETVSWRGRGLVKLLDAEGMERLVCHACWSGW